MFHRNRWRGPDSFWSARWSGQEARHSCYALAGLHSIIYSGWRSCPRTGVTRSHRRGGTGGATRAPRPPHPAFWPGFFVGLWRNGIRPRLGSGDPSQDLRVRIPPAPP